MIKQGNEEALALMIEKYRYLIAKKIGKFNLTRDYDDFFQEATIVLYKSVMKFEERFNKSFTRYFENNLENYYISVLRKRKTYHKFINDKLPLLYDYHVDEHASEYYRKEEIIAIINEFSGFEKGVFKIRYLDGNSPVKTAEIIGCDIKKVYNAMDRIRNKLKMHLDI